MNRNKNIQDLLSSFRLILDPTTGGFYNENVLMNIPRKVARHSNNMVYRIVLSFILKNTIPYYLNIFMDNGGWNLICKWLQKAMETDHDMLIIDILRIIQNTTVTIDQLISNAIPSLINKLLSTHINPEIKSIAQDIVNDSYYRLLTTHRQNVMNKIISKNEFDSMSDSEIEFGNKNEEYFVIQPWTNQLTKTCLHNTNKSTSIENECTNKTNKIYNTAIIDQVMLTPEQEPSYQSQLKFHQDSSLKSSPESINNQTTINYNITINNWVDTSKPNPIHRAQLKHILDSLLTSITNLTYNRNLDIVTISQQTDTPRPKPMHMPQLKLRQDSLLNSTIKSINTNKTIKKNNNTSINQGVKFSKSKPLQEPNLKLCQDSQNKSIIKHNIATINHAVGTPKSKPMHQPPLKLHRDSLLNSTIKSINTNKTIKKNNNTSINQGVKFSKSKPLQEPNLKLCQDSQNNSIIKHNIATINHAVGTPKLKPMHQPPLKLRQYSLLNATTTTKSINTNETIKKNNIATFNKNFKIPKLRPMHQPQLKFDQDTSLNSSTSSINSNKTIIKTNNENLNGTNNTAITLCNNIEKQKSSVQKSNVLDKAKFKINRRKLDELDLPIESEKKKFKPSIDNIRKITKPFKVESFIKPK